MRFAAFAAIAALTLAPLPAAAQNAPSPEKKPDLIVVMAGCNNAWNYRNSHLSELGLSLADSSAGGGSRVLRPLLDLLDSFEPEAPASLFVVLHRRNEAGHLLDILRRRSPIEVIEPEDGCPIRHGCLHLAPPDTHMLVGDGHVHLRGGPKENNFRPAIDPLFRSLAVFGGGRTTAVILSGYLDDGAAGCRAIVGAGGGGIVQDPNDSTSPSMPRAAISAVASG